LTNLPTQSESIVYLFQFGDFVWRIWQQL